MVGYVILGFALLLGVGVLAKWYSSAAPKDILRTVKWTLFVLGILLALFFIITGRLAWVFATLPAILPIFMRARHAHRTFKNFSRMASGGQGGGGDDVSAIETEYLSMSLDQSTGTMTGEVLKGTYAGRSLDDLDEREFFDLLQTCQTHDRESARLLQSYLEREHPGWRESSQQQHTRSAGSSEMDVAEALAILGLENDATDEDVIKAHRRLISNLHPDHGGSGYLAAKINQAKDVLLS